VKKKHFLLQHLLLLLLNQCCLDYLEKLVHHHQDFLEVGLLEVSFLLLQFLYIYYNQNLNLLHRLQLEVWYFYRHHPLK
jgi:hypothetical protein